MAGSPAHLYGEGVDHETLARVATECGFVPTPEGEKPNGSGSPGVLLLASPAIAGIGEWLSCPVQAYVELIEGEPAINPETLETIRSSRLCFSLATSTAFTLDSAAMVCEALVARGILTPMRRSDVELSLHETISNAVVHGNLAIESNTKGDVANFARFAQSLQSSMKSPEARLRVDIAATWDHEFLDITVIDKGKGYDASKLPTDVDPFAPAGRGLAIIRSLALSMNVTHGGRITTLRFLT